MDDCRINKVGQNNIVIYCNQTDPWPKPPTQKIFWHFIGKENFFSYRPTQKIPRMLQ